MHSREQPFARAVRYPGRRAVSPIAMGWERRGSAPPARARPRTGAARAGGCRDCRPRPRARAALCAASLAACALCAVVRPQPVAGLCAERRPAAAAGGAWGAEAAWLRRGQLRLRGGLRADPPPRETPGEHSLVASDPEGANGCLALSPAENRTLRRQPAAAGLEVSAIDASGQPLQDQGAGDSMRYAWNPERRVWLLFKRPDEDLSIESLRGKWDFAPSDCLTFRHRLPDKWQHVDWAPGWLGWLEFFFFSTPVLNQLLYLWRGLFACVVCGRARSEHPCRSERDADAAFWKAVKFRDVELAVRLVRGGVECEPGGANWCLLVCLRPCVLCSSSPRGRRLGPCRSAHVRAHSPESSSPDPAFSARWCVAQAFLQGNYCQGAFSQIRGVDQEKAHEHLWKPPPRTAGLTGWEVPYL